MTWELEVPSLLQAGALLVEVPVLMRTAYADGASKT